MNEVIETIAVIDRGPISFRFDALVEDQSPQGEFDDNEVVVKILMGDLQWFMVRCSAIMEDIVLAESYLGGCCYNSFADFMDEAYVDDLIEEARAGALQKLAALLILNDFIDIEQASAKING
jgi:hypothetical protein